MTTIAIDYAQLSTIVIFLFVAVGFFRGFAREVFTSIVLLALNYLIVNPGFARTILDWANRFIKLPAVVISNPGAAATMQMQDLATAYSDAGPVITDDNSFMFFMIVLVGALLVSYLVGGKAIGQEGVSPLSRLLGGVLGFLNGSMIISLTKEYLLGNFLKTGSTATASATAQSMPQTLAFEVSNVPAQPALSSAMTLLFIATGVFVVFMIVLGERFSIRLPLGKK
jgi:uncharacterized membrane protein required for colicin V production